MKMTFRCDNMSMLQYVREQRCPTHNSKDTWHANKGTTREVKQITSGRQYFEGKTWSAELADKAASIKTAVYFCMKHCCGNAEKLRSSIDNIIPHYKGNHTDCHHDSRCKKDIPYLPTKTIITSLRAEQLLRECLHKLVIYKDAEAYCYCSDTHYVESFNNALLQYHDKRIVFGKAAYTLRINLSILDWNEHVDRPVTSVRHAEDVQAPRRQVPLKVHTKKTNDFKKNIWQQWMRKC